MTSRVRSSARSIKAITDLVCPSEPRHVLVSVDAGACAVVSLVFPLEFIGTEWRDACVCSGIWVVGVVVISLELLVTRHWRYLAFLSGGIGLPLIGTYL